MAWQPTTMDKPLRVTNEMFALFVPIIHPRCAVRSGAS